MKFHLPKFRVFCCFRELMLDWHRQTSIGNKINQIKLPMHATEPPRRILNALLTAGTVATVTVAKAPAGSEQTVRRQGGTAQN